MAIILSSRAVVVKYSCRKASLSVVLSITVLVLSFFHLSHYPLFVLPHLASRLFLSCFFFFFFSNYSSLCASPPLADPCSCSVWSYLASTPLNKSEEEDRMHYTWLTGWQTAQHMAPIPLRWACETSINSTKACTVSTALGRERWVAAEEPPGRAFEELGLRSSKEELKYSNMVLFGYLCTCILYILCICP